MCDGDGIFFLAALGERGAYNPVMGLGSLGLDWVFASLAPRFPWFVITYMFMIMSRYDDGDGDDAFWG